jgi:fucose 4-O-acetylase-like acetyltransferase
MPILREAWIDWLKAVAIVVVVWIHASQLGRPDDAVARILTRLSHFAVPAFFFVAGYTARGGEAALGRRIERLVLPYLAASLIIIAWARPPLLNAVLMLAGGWAFGIYYFVPMMVVVAITLWLVGRLPLRWRGAALLLLIAVSILGGFHLDPLTYWIYPRNQLFWMNRNPIRWIGFASAGCLMAHLRPAPVPRAPRVAVVLALAAIMISALPELLSMPRGSVQYISAKQAIIYSATLAIVVGAATDAPRVVRAISANTYPIYLWHFPILTAWRASVSPSYGSELIAIILATAVPATAAWTIKRRWPKAARWTG